MAENCQVLAMKIPGEGPRGLIRAARPQEAAQLSDLARRSKAHWGYAPEFMASCREELTIEPDDVDAGLTFVMEADGTVLGFYAVKQVAHDRMELGFLFVEPAAIGRGYGRALIEHAKCCVRTRGCRILEIQGDPHTAAFYRAAAGRLVGERPSASITGRMLPLFEIDLSTT